ncbi:MAG: hypothetical protein KME27_05560 [Lyngbya sp. HA4199-MV5]|nr:hypothetical protein [Lyngbya sp. HA4199-MV5]
MSSNTLDNGSISQWYFLVVFYPKVTCSARDRSLPEFGLASGQEARLINHCGKGNGVFVAPF